MFEIINSFLEFAKKVRIIIESIKLGGCDIIYIYIYIYIYMLIKYPMEKGIINININMA